jgi:hypothetical protein
MERFNGELREKKQLSLHTAQITESFKLRQAFHVKSSNSSEIGCGEEKTTQIRGTLKVEAYEL